MKKEWKKPQLTVLVRTRPEEAILGTCKEAPEKSGSGAEAEYGQCNSTNPEGCAGPCATHSGS